MSEYWIDNYGHVTYCDGDAGVDVANHEMVARQHAFGLVHAALEAANRNKGDYPSLEDDPVYVDFLSVFDSIASNEYGLDCTDLRCKLCDVNPSQDLSSVDLIVIWTGLPELVVQFALQSEPNTEDVRLYAMQHWGWHRVVVKGSYPSIESWRVTRQLIKRMHFWIEECEDGREGITWTWYVRSTGKQFEITSEEMRDGLINVRSEVR